MTASKPAESNLVFRRQHTRLRGIFFDEFVRESAWLRERATLQFPPQPGLKQITVRGEFRVHPGLPAATPCPALIISCNGTTLARISPTQPGPWETTVGIPASAAASVLQLQLTLEGVAWTNFLAWLGRIFSGWPALAAFQPYRAQNKNRQLRLTSIEADGEVVYDFTNRHAPYSVTFARRHAKLGLNIVGYHAADLGVGESARCMIRAAEAASLPVAIVPLKLHCKATQGDSTYVARFQDTNPHIYNVVHLDAPGSADIDHHHGPAFLRGKYNIGYWAWELPEFPDSWLPFFDYYHEIWCPSDFVHDAIAAKSPVPVITMPHAISFPRPTMSKADLRAKFSLPASAFLFLFLYDLNSYSERKNPRAVIDAFRRSGLAQRGASLVIKIHGLAGNEAALESLRTSLADLPGTQLIARSLSRAEVYELEAACDCFVSLHRSEGFGLAVAECMYLGKPVISTHWSATAEFLNESNGCPVHARLIQLEQHHGPYGKGQTWADPDVTHAAEWMQKLHADPALCARLGAAARATMEKDFSPAAIGARYRARLEAIASW